MPIQKGNTRLFSNFLLINFRYFYFFRIFLSASDFIWNFGFLQAKKDRIWMVGEVRNIANR